jgi:hypothetical protein
MLSHAKSLEGVPPNALQRYRGLGSRDECFNSFGRAKGIRKRDERHLIQKWQPEQDMIRKSVSHDDYKRYCGLIHYQSFTGRAVHP